ncbi:MAG: rRNA maturation RNase YbeY [Candidatus Riflebacteria bacterium]|nr:rRNA maturation RNase YbeY [Candidatus Riflebacteria bacterium]
MQVLASNEHSSFDDLDLEAVKKIACEIMMLEKIPDNAELSLVFCDDDTIKDLNNNYRGKNEPTDVLSFPMPQNKFDNFEPETILLGDIVISLDTALRQANELKHSLITEITFLLIHGILHLIGFDHINEEERKVMLGRESDLFKKLNLNSKTKEAKISASTVIGRTESFA